jgi:hypothetical protein
VRVWVGAVVAAVLACGPQAENSSDPAFGPESEEAQAAFPDVRDLLKRAAGPWPSESLIHYSTTYGVGEVQSVGVDDAYNIWLLRGDEIGVLRPGTTAPVWTRAVGQAGRGFRSTVICGGSQGRAYVGYLTHDLAQPDTATAEEKLMGDADVVRLMPSGAVTLEKHLMLVNSNDPRFDETRTILACAKVMFGAQRGDVFFGTNHAITRVRGLEFSDHRHPVFKYPEPNGSLHIGYHWAVSITPSGDVFLANDWKVALFTPPPRLEDFLDPTLTPWKLDTFVEVLGPQHEMDHWRATAQTQTGRYFLGSKQHGLWEMTLTPRTYRRVGNVPSSAISALAGTMDGSLFVGTEDRGLWRVLDSGHAAHISQVQGTHVRQLVYDPTVLPPMLYVVTNAGLFVIRGP